MKKITLQLQAYSVHANAQRFTTLGVQVCIKAGTEQTGGRFNLFDVLCPAGYETPLHIHYAEDVALQVLEGDLDIYWGDTRMRAESGSYFFQPRGTPHGIRVNATTARILYMTVPAGFDGFVIECSRPIASAKATVVAAHSKIEVLGSLPGEDTGIQKLRRRSTK